MGNSMVVPVFDYFAFLWSHRTSNFLSKDSMLFLLESN